MPAKTVLVVEDSQPDQVLTAQRIREKWEDVVILTSSSFANAMEIIKNQHPDMVLLDLNLDDSMGTDTLKNIRAVHPAISIVVLTGMETDGTINDCLKAGANHVCIKSQMLDDDFFNVLEEHIGQS